MDLQENISVFADIRMNVNWKGLTIFFLVIGNLIPWIILSHWFAWITMQTILQSTSRNMFFKVLINRIYYAWLMTVMFQCVYGRQKFAWMKHSFFEQLKYPGQTECVSISDTQFDCSKFSDILGSTCCLSENLHTEFANFRIDKPRLQTS